MKLNVQLISSSEVLFEGTASSAIFPGEKGIFEICPFHKPLISRLLPGVAIIDDKTFEIKHGVIKVENNEVKAIVNSDMEILNRH